MIERFSRKYLNWVNSNKKLFIVIIISVFLITAYLSSNLKLRSSLKELLPEDSPSVVQLNKMLDKVGGISALTVAIESPNVEANQKFVDALTEKIQSLPNDNIKFINAKVDNIRKFYEDNMLHFVDKKDLEKLYFRLKRFVDYEKLKRTPFFVDLEEG